MIKKKHFMYFYICLKSSIKLIRIEMSSTDLFTHFLLYSTSDGAIVVFAQLVPQRVEPANWTIFLHITNGIPEREN